MQIQWKRGQFQKFFTLMKINIGGKDPVAIAKGDEFEYDGTICRYAGAELPTPSLRGAIRDDWVTMGTDAGSAPPTYQPPRAVAKSQMMSKDLSRVQRTQPGTMSADSLDEDTVLTVSDRQQLPKDERGRIAGHLDQSHNRRGVVQDDGRQVAFKAPVNPNAGQRVLNPSPSDYDHQDGRVVGRVMSPANIGKVDMIREPGKAKDIERAHSVDFGAGRAHSAGGSRIHKEGVDISMNVGSVDRGLVYDGDDSDGHVVGQVRHTDRRQSSEGVDVEDTSDIRSHRKEASANGKVASAKKPQSKPGMTKVSKALPKAVEKAVAPKAATEVAIDTKLPPRIRMARRIDPSFPKSWVFSGKLAERMEAVRKHGATPEFLEALYAAEGDQMRRKLEEEFPQQFGV